MNQEVKDWLNYSKMDLDGAEILNSSRFPKPIPLVCYHCQQSAEKAIKTLIIYFGFTNSMPKSHDITLLLDQIKNKVHISDDLYKRAALLTKCGVETRYPNELDLTEDDANLLINYAEDIYNWVISIVDDNSSK